MVNLLRRFRMRKITTDDELKMLTDYMAKDLPKKKRERYAELRKKELDERMASNSEINRVFSVESDRIDVLVSEGYSRESINDYKLRIQSICDCRGGPYWVDDENTKLAELRNIDFNVFYDYMRGRIFGHDDALKTACYYVWDYLRAIASPGYVHRNNFIIAGISGSGKTEFMRSLSEFMSQHFPLLHLTVSRVDTSSITEAGYRGVDFNNLIGSTYKDISGVNIIFLDEFDKKLIPSYSSHGVNTSDAIQNNMLVAIEGSKICFKENLINTSNTLFIGLGTFDSVRHKKTVHSCAIGYNTNDVDIDYDSKYWNDITLTDIMDQGAKDELLGRFTDVVNFGALDDRTLVEILHRHVRENYEDNPSSIISKIFIGEKAENQLLLTARNSHRGAREMKYSFDKAMRDIMINVAHDFGNVKSNSIVVKMNDLHDISVESVESVENVESNEIDVVIDNTENETVCE